MLDDLLRFAAKKLLILTWDLLKSSPDWEEYVPMKYGVFFSDPEVEHSKKQREEEEKSMSPNRLLTLKSQVGSWSENTSGTCLDP